MGSITSRPKAPSYSEPQIVYVQTPASTTATPTSSSPSSGSASSTGGAATTAQDDQAAADKAASEARSESLLKRDRSRLGTVLTGFRGLLGLGDSAPQRKTLLGE